MMRFVKAANGGAARQNLKLLEVIVGPQQNRAMEFDKFQACANVLETLTQDEITFLGRLHRDYGNAGRMAEFKQFMASISDDYHEIEIHALAAALTRTGMLVPFSAWGGMVYNPTPRLFEICELASVRP